MKTLMMSTVAAVFAFGTAYAQDVLVLIDEDSDGQITVQEWEASRADTTAVFGEWDTDADNILSRDEYEAGVEMQDDADTFGAWDDYYTEWDEDQDGMLTQDEYDAGLFDTFDTDDDELWTEEETKAWEEDEMRYDATRSGREVSRSSGRN
jgi:hypothetical protein